MLLLPTQPPVSDPPAPTSGSDAASFDAAEVAGSDPTSLE
jgi:hypothetical protein